MVAGGEVVQPGGGADGAGPDWSQAERSSSLAAELTALQSDLAAAKASEAAQSGRQLELQRNLQKLQAALQGEEAKQRQLTCESEAKQVSH